MDARTVGKVEHIVIEGYWMTFFFSFEHFLGQDFILSVKHREILLSEGIRVIGAAHNRFHGKLGKTKVCKVENVLGKVCVCVGVGARVALANKVNLCYNFTK